jgi:hypothetical protein
VKRRAVREHVTLCPSRAANVARRWMQSLFSFSCDRAGILAKRKFRLLKPNLMVLSNAAFIFMLSAARVYEIRMRSRVGKNRFN